jgi:hypothetical protein
MSAFIDRLTAMSNEKRLYTLATLPAHLAAVGQFERLNRLLTRLDFIEAKCSENMAVALLDDYHRTLDKLPEFAQYSHILNALVDFRDFVRSQLNILSAYPELTFQQAANQPAQSAPELRARDRWDSCRETRPWLRWLNKPHYRAEIIIIEIPRERVLCAVGRDDQTEVFLGTDSGLLWRIDLRTGRASSLRLLNTLSFVTACVLLTHTPYLLLATHDGTLVQFNSERNTWDRVWIAHVGRISAMAVSLDGSKLITAGEDGNLCLWALDHGLITNGSVIYKEEHRITSIAFALRDQVVVVGTSSGKLRLLDGTSSWRQFYYDWKHSRAITCCVSTDQGAILWTGSLDGSVRVLRISANFQVEEKATFRGGSDITYIAPLSKQVRKSFLTAHL